MWGQLELRTRGFEEGVEPGRGLLATGNEVAVAVPGLADVAVARCSTRCRSVTASTFVVLAVAPDAMIDSRGFDDAVRRAVARLAELTADCRATRVDEEIRAEWERTVLARAVAVAIVVYRAEQDLQPELPDAAGASPEMAGRHDHCDVDALASAAGHT